MKDQGRHGTSSVYLQWSDKFSSIDCIVDPPRTQGIVEFHQKSAKHITMNSRRERLDGVIKNLRLAKISKSRNFEIMKSRSQKKKNSLDSEKVKDPFTKISTEKWKKPKQSKGPGFFQQKRTIKSKKNKNLGRNFLLFPGVVNISLTMIELLE